MRELARPCRCQLDRARLLDAHRDTCATTPPTPSPAIASGETRGTSTCRSMRSSSGPEIRPRYAAMRSGVQRHGAERSPRWPHGTGIHRGHELEARGELRLARRPRNHDVPGFERLAQHFEHAAVELRQLVEEQHAVVRERDLARPRVAAATDECDPGGGVMRRAERTTSPLVATEPGRRERAHRRRLERLVLAHRRQDARQPLREHALAGARRTDQQQAVLAGRGNLERAPRVLLAAQIGEVRAIGLSDCLRRLRRLEQRPHAAGETCDFPQVPGTEYPAALRKRRFGEVALGQDDAVPGARALQRRRQHAADCVQVAAQRQLAVEFGPVERPLRQLRRRDQDADCDRQVEPPAFLRQVGRREIDGDVPRREDRSRC